MESYNAYIARKQLNEVDDMIDNLPQPTMFGGKRVRQFVLPGNTEYDYPSSLAVQGSAGNTMADEYIHREPLGADPSTWTPKHLHQGGAIWDYAKPVMDFASPIVQNLAKDVAMKALQGKLCPSKKGSGRRGRPKKGGFGWGDIAGPLQDIGKDVAKEAIVSAIKGRGRPKKGGFGWGDISRGFQEVGKTLAPGANELKESLGPIAKEALVGAIVGKGRRRGRPKKGGDAIGNWFKKTFEPVSKPYEAVGINPFNAGYDFGHEILGPAIFGKGRKERSKKGGFGWGDIVSGFHAVDNVAKPIARELLPIAVETAMAGSRKKKGGALYPDPHYAQHANYPAYPPNLNRNMLYHDHAVATGAGRKTRKPSARNEIVKKVMKEKGLSLPQASKYVKEHGLY